MGPLPGKFESEIPELMEKIEEFSMSLWNGHKRDAILFELAALDGYSVDEIVRRVAFEGAPDSMRRRIDRAKGLALALWLRRSARPREETSLPTPSFDR